MARLKSLRCWFSLSAALALFLDACGKKTEVKSELSILEKAFPTATAAAPPSQPASVAPTNSANDLVTVAVTAARANDFAGGVIALQEATSKPGITADQVLAIHEAKRAMVEQLQNRAARGDQAALNQLKAIEKTRSQ